MATLFTALENSFKSHPEKLAVIHEQAQVKYSEFMSHVEKIRKDVLSAGTTLSVTFNSPNFQGIKPQEVVGLMAPNGLPFLSLFIGVVSARAISAPLNPAYLIDDFLFYMEDTGMKVTPSF